MSAWTGNIANRRRARRDARVILDWEVTALVDDDLTQAPQVRGFWHTYAKVARLKEATYAAFGFGDSAELADELVELVIAGAKRTRTNLPRDFDVQNRPLPKPGDLAVVVDGAKTPRCIIRTLHVETKRMRDVDAQFAWETGGGDRSLEWWLSAHTRYFKRRGAREGFAVDGDTEVVLERFEVVWPKELADRKKERRAPRGQNRARS
jgi:uncharacterized protein YhfF